VFTDLDDESREVVLKPGPMSEVDTNFLDAYKAMAEKAGSTFQDALEQRYELVQKEYETASESRKNELDKELANIGKPPGEKGDKEWNEFFLCWLQKNRTQNRQLAGGASRQQLAPLQNILMMAAARNLGVSQQVSVKRRVRVPELDTLRSAVDEHPAIDWNDKMQQLAGEELEVLQDDDEDGTSKLRFLKGSLTLWLPTRILTNLDSE